MVAEPELHPASQGPPQVRRLAVPVGQAAAAEVAAGDDRGDAERCVNFVSITSITLTTSP